MIPRVKAIEDITTPAPLIPAPELVHDTLQLAKPTLIRLMESALNEQYFGFRVEVISVKVDARIGGITCVEYRKVAK